MKLNNEELLRREKLNIELATLRGWTDIEILYGRTPDERSVIGLHPPIDNWQGEKSYIFQSKTRIPDYCADANAVALVRKSLNTKEQTHAFMDALYKKMQPQAAGFAFTWIMMNAELPDQTEALIFALK
jgi:hypothetical protein